MTESKIEKRGFSGYNAISLPYTAPTDGFLMIQIGANTSSLASYVVVNDGTQNWGAVTAPNGVDACAILPVKKGAYLQQTDSNNLRYLHYYFMKM